MPAPGRREVSACMHGRHGKHQRQHNPTWIVGRAGASSMDHHCPDSEHLRQNQPCTSESSGPVVGFSGPGLKKCYGSNEVKLCETPSVQRFRRPSGVANVMALSRLGRAFLPHDHGRHGCRKGVAWSLGLRDGYGPQLGAMICVKVGRRGAFVRRWKRAAIVRPQARTRRCAKRRAG